MTELHKIAYCFTLAASCLLLAMLTACTSAVEVPGPVSGEPLKHIVFTVRMPNATPHTYGMSEAAENEIRTIDVLVFRVDEDTQAEYFDYRAKGIPTTITPPETTPYNEKSFSVVLQKNDTTDCRLVFLANVEDELETLSPAHGAQKEALLARLLSHNLMVWNVTSGSYKPLPMWGQSAGNLRINDSMKEHGLQGITLLRSVVSIEVYADEPAVIPDFTLTDVYLYNRKVYGRVAPNDLTSGIITDGDGMRVTSPSIPTENMLQPLTVWSGQHYAVPPGDHKLLQTIYTYEAAAVDRGDDFAATCLVVGGTYTPLGVTQYYRLDFEKRNSGGVFEAYRPLLRNHRYKFIIKNVTGDGHNTADSAFYSKKGNLGVEILDWNLADMSNVVVKEMHWLSLNLSTITTGNAGGTFYVGVETSHPAGWTATTSDGWITVDDSHDGYMKIIVGPETVSRTGTISVKAGNMTKNFRVMQNPSS